MQEVPSIKGPTLEPKQKGNGAKPSLTISSISHRLMWSALIFPFLSGCLGTPYPFGTIVRNERQPAITSISIQKFKNKTGEAGLERRLVDALVHEFEQDRRFSYTSDESKADGILMGTIRQFEETAIKQHKDVNLVENRLSIIAELKFVNRARKQVLWEDELLERRSTFVGDLKCSSEAEELAKNELFQRFAKDIVRRTLEKLEKETRPASRKVNDDSLPANPPPEYPSTAPF